MDASRGDLGANDVAPMADAPTLDTGPVPDAGNPDTGPPAVRLIGRFDLTHPSQPSGTWSASAMEARFTGTSVSAQLGGSGNYFATVVDGVVQPTPIVTNGSMTYSVASGLSTGTHQVLVFRRDEAFDQPAQFVGFTFGGGGALLPPPPTPSRRIELIGDSISAGYGDECAMASTHFSQPTENEYIAYGPITARSLGADLHVIAWSGKGMYQNLDGSTTDTMPILWHRTNPNDAASVWDATQWIPDAVVINLGTNDYGAPGGNPTANFQAAYLQFVMTLRGVYPHAYIFCTVGPMLGGANYISAMGAINNVISMRNAAGDTRLALVAFPTQNCGATGTGCGCDYHPNAATHQAMATVLEAAIHGALGW